MHWVPDCVWGQMWTIVAWRVEMEVRWASCRVAFESCLAQFLDEAPQWAPFTD